MPAQSCLGGTEEKPLQLTDAYGVELIGIDRRPFRRRGKIGRLELAAALLQPSIDVFDLHRVQLQPPVAAGLVQRQQAFRFVVIDENVAELFARLEVVDISAVERHLHDLEPAPADAVAQMPMQLSQRHARLQLLIALQLAAITVVGGVTVVRFHIFAAVDELAHISFVQQVAEHGSLPWLGRSYVSWQMEAIEQDVYPRRSSVNPRQIGLAGLSYEAFQPPLYYVLAWLWSRPFGLSEAGLRSFSALAGTLTVPLAYDAGKHLISERAGLLTAGLMAKPAVELLGCWTKTTWLAAAGVMLKLPDCVPVRPPSLAARV